MLCCKNCIYCQNVGQEGFEKFECRFNPPSIAGFPNVKADDWCAKCNTFKPEPFPPPPEPMKRTKKPFEDLGFVFEDSYQR